MKSSIRTILYIVPALIVYAFLAHQLNFIQDDAYISYRYVANFLNGDGLVYNIGELVEGFTNFGWIVFLIQFGALGFDFIFWSQVLGFCFGAGIIVLTFFLSRLIIKNDLSSIIATLLVGANMSLAYWAPAGLETAAFGFFALLSFYFYLKRSYWLIWGLVMSVWMRPEGALVALLLLIVEAVRERRLPKFSLICGITAFILSLPFVGFKLFYYGSILPNPFYAKTGFSLAQLGSGLEYAGRFFSHYGFWGIGFVIPLILIKRLSSQARTLLLFTALYIIYIILVGGDVLKAHRFFLPLFGPAAILVVLTITLLIRKFSFKTRQLILVLIAIPLLALTYILPLDFVTNYNDLEKFFTKKMGMEAEHMKATDSTNFSAALSTIGIFGYKLLGHDIIDMVGLTDSTVARHPEKPIVGMETTWKERNYNSAYILKRAPDYILFSTGIKPSAPAEKALLLYPQFQQAYRTVAWYFKVNQNSKGTLHPAYIKRHPIVGELKPTYSLEFVNNYKLGLEYKDSDPSKAIMYYNRALRASHQPLKTSRQPPYLYLMYFKGKAHIMANDFGVGLKLLNAVVEADSTTYIAHFNLYIYCVLSQDTAKAAIHERWLKKLVPWYVDRVKEQAAEILRKSR